jgi:cytochrome c
MRVMVLLWLGRVVAVAVAAASLIVGITGCATSEGPRTASPALSSGGSPGAGRAAIVAAGCGSCHRIPGVPNADALVGPPLDSWSRRSFIAGTLPNSEPNLVAWVRDPQAIRPGTAMPTLELSDQQVLDIVAYLFTLD